MGRPGPRSWPLFGASLIVRAVGARMRQVSPAEAGLPASVNRYLLPQERSCITVRRHPAVLAGDLILASGGLVAARKLASRPGRPDIVWGACLLLLLDIARRV